jgi:ATP-binding cassette subfamily F protein 3
MLGAFLFRGDDVYKSLDVLSGGEKSRVALLQLLLSPVNLLVLDEPTNHLDIHSKDVLLQALRDFGGTVIFVSHDRGFIEQLATRVLELKPGHFKNYPGNYEFYMEQVAKLEGQENNPVVVEVHEEKPTSWEEQKKLEAARRKAEKEVANLEAKITELEEKKSALENKMADPAVYSNGEKAKAVQREIEELAAQIEETTTAWEAAAEKLG